jgi:hypothetical protein
MRSTTRRPLGRQHSRGHLYRTCYKQDQLTFLLNYLLLYNIKSTFKNELYKTFYR